MENKFERIISIIGVVLIVPIVLWGIYYYNNNGTNGIPIFLGGIATLMIYTILYRENPIYRVAEHIFIGLGVGYGLMMTWIQVLGPRLYHPVFEQGQWPWLTVLPLALMAYFVFSKKHGWVSRITLGLFIGLAAGMIFQSFAQTYFPQISDSFRPIVPTVNRLSSSYAEVPKGAITIDNAINNVIFLVTIFSVITYFLFAFEQKSKAVRGFAQWGRWIIMIGFGAIFGSTLMTRFALLVDRMYLLLVEWLHLSPPVG